MQKDLYDNFLEYQINEDGSSSQDISKLISEQNSQMKSTKKKKSGIKSFLRKLVPGRAKK